MRSAFGHSDHMSKRHIAMSTGFTLHTEHGAGLDIVVPKETTTLSTIVVHLDHTERCEARTLLAARLARQHDSHLLGIVPTGVPVDAAAALARAAEIAPLVAAASLHQRRRAEAVAHVFRCRLRDTGGSPSCEIRLVDGDPVDAVIAHGRASDLIVVGQADHRAAVDARARQLPEEAMLHAGRPVLIVPRRGRFDGAMDRVLVAWDGGREAALSVYGALPLMRKASRVTVVSLLEDGGAESAGTPCPGDLDGWLLRHGIRADVECCAAARGGLGDALLARASALEAGLIVMGGYGHAQAQERVLGGVTRDVLARTTTPVLMAH